MSKYQLVSGGSPIPVPGGKTIEELFGRVHTGTEQFSLAHMVAPGHWSEPPQTPEFGELTIMIRGRLQISVDGEEVTVATGQSLWVEPGATVHYRNAFDEEAEYYAICLPAFSLELAHRHDE
jgi:mannose-6-phosphate isomerase-like protein (cupin superfamily)